MPATLEEPRPMPTPAVDDGEFVDFGWRPIFAEHVNTKDFGKPVRFGREAMEQIAARNNERLDETGDFCPIAIRHTRDGSDFDPEVVGLFGPYRAQRMKNGRWAVYARERWYKEDAPKRKKYPRCSVEYWANREDPTTGYFDPVSMLGAETPELDLGTHYKADPLDSSRQLVRYQKVYRYSAASAGGANTFVPDDSSDRPVRYESGSLSQADILQIITALKPVIEEAVETKVAAMQPVGADPNNLLSDAEPGAMPGEMPGEIPGEADEPFAESDDMPPGDSDQMGPTADELNFGDEAPGDDADDDSDDDQPDDTDVDDESPAEIDDEMPAKYMAAGHSSETFDEESDMADNAEVVARYQREAADYKKKHDDLHAKYQKTVSENATLKTENESLKAEKRNAVRYQKLNELHAQGIVFDLNTEGEDCKDLSDEQFDRHLERIKTNYSRVPLGTLVPEGTKITGPARTVDNDRIDAKKRARYSKLAGDNVLKARHEKKAIDFKDEFERLMETDPENIGKSAA